MYVMDFDVRLTTEEDARYGIYTNISAKLQLQKSHMITLDGDLVSTRPDRYIMNPKISRLRSREIWASSAD
jgi:hypothetical protein